MQELNNNSSIKFYSFNKFDKLFLINWIFSLNKYLRFKCTLNIINFKNSINSCNSLAFK